MENPFNPGYWTENDLQRFGFCSVGTNVRIAKNCTIIGLKNITIGSNVRIDGPTVLTASIGYITFGNYIHVGGFSFLAGAAGITFSDFSGISQRVSVYSVSDDYSGNSLTNPTVPSKFTAPRFSPVCLNRHVIVGAGSIILPGCDIGEGSAVGALSLVTKNLDAWGVYSGTPARKLRERSKNLLENELVLLKNSNGFDK